MSKKLQSDVIEVIEKIFQLESGTLKEDVQAEEVEKWDSLGHLSILVALDKFFDGKVAEITEMAGADSMPKILAALREHGLID